jgi:Ca2+-binding RTX toxin-like protein
VSKYTLLNQVKITIHAPASVTNCADWQVNAEVQSLATDGQNRSQAKLLSHGIGTITAETYLVTDPQTNQAFLSTTIRDANGLSKTFTESLDRGGNLTNPHSPLSIYAALDQIKISVQAPDSSTKFDGWEITTEVNDLITDGQNKSQSAALSNGAGTIDTQTYLITDPLSGTVATAYAVSDTTGISQVIAESITSFSGSTPVGDARSLVGILPDRPLNLIFAPDRPNHHSPTAGTDSNDFISGSDRHDILTGGAGNDYLYGYNGNDLLLGGAGKDLLNGGRGNDTLDGYGGNGDSDFLIGGAGADRFILAKNQQSYYTGDGYATISDFNGAEGDKIRLSGRRCDYTYTVGTGIGESTTATSNDLVIRLKSNHDAIAVIQNVTSLDRFDLIFC